MARFTKLDKLAKSQGCWYDPDAAAVAVDFIETVLCHSKGQWAGQPFILIGWERDLTEQLFGWKRKDGTRRYRKCGVWMAKKNGKTTWAAAIGKVLLVMDFEASPEVYSAAADREQASIVYREMRSMVQKSPELSSRLMLIDSKKTIANPLDDGRYVALSSEVGTKEGLNWSGLIFDELHTQKTPALWESLIYGGSARRQPLLLTISTAGWDMESIGREQCEYAAKVLSGEIEDTSFLPFIAEATEDDDLSDEKTWHKANPSLGVTIPIESFRADYREARSVPRKWNAFKRYRLNMWTAVETAWIVPDAWKSCERNIALDDHAGNDCYMGLDLARTTDLVALVLAFPNDDNEFAVFPFFFLPKDGIADKERKDGVQYQTWARQGLVELTPGNVTDYAFIRERIRSLAKRFHVVEIAFDPWNSSHLITELQDDNFECVEFRQGYKSMSPSTKEFERLVLCEKLAHDGNPILTWNIGNVAVKTDEAGNVKPDKKASKNKIDGAVAAIMAVERARVRVTVAEPMIEAW